MSSVANKIIQAAAGNSGDITGELIEVAGSSGSSVTLSSAPQAGDLLIAHTGGYIFGASLNSAFTTVETMSSSTWYPAAGYYEGSAIGYRIATGSEGTSNAVGGSSCVLAVYRFSSPVISVTTAFTVTQQGGASRTINVSSYDKPHIVVCSVGSHADPSIAMTNQDYSNRFGYVDAAASLANLDSSTTSSVTTLNSVGFNPACSFAVLVPNFD